ncbi:hypothetical protein F53441_6425 [Fusarium austroafricanum]|uniref:Uncharacterized protein n=1 Tax=Fusarium austroafricanum TaxID=2364996 RepID=A0A8H4KHT8_9HYPO|nr:hypothetical protein F53441_6425 [Fusarium austroafricanum]
MDPDDQPSHPGIHLPGDFHFGEVDFRPHPPPQATPDPPLGILASFAGSFAGPGFNTIFRPNSVSPTTTTFTNPVIPAPPAPPNVAVLELNLTTEELTFSAPLGSVPNRGLKEQNDIFLNGVSYLQTVNDVTNTVSGKADGKPTGIHTETGFWLNVPETNNNPKLGNTLVRLGSIPHGTTINAQGSVPNVVKSAPPISPRSITPFTIGNPKDIQIKASQKASDANTARLPQDLSLFIQKGSITQDILDNPAKILTDINSQLKIIETSTFEVQTMSTTEPGGGTANIAFLVGQNATLGPNADAVEMDATFWVETVEAEITITSYQPGAPLFLQPNFKPMKGIATPPMPTFSVTPPEAVTSPKTITVTYTQIQYAQMVFLNFNGLSWPHLSLATLVPTAPIVVPSSAFGDM